jgi:hypothetical protein
VWEIMRAPDLWQWLTPVAACLMTMAVFMTNSGQHPIQGGSDDCATFYATVMTPVPHESNALHQTIAMNRATVNLEWNVIPGFSFDATNLGPLLPTKTSRETNVWRDEKS